MNWLLFGLAAIYVLAMLCMVAIIGKPREPLTHGTAIASLLYGSLLVTALVAAGLRFT